MDHDTFRAELKYSNYGRTNVSLSFSVSATWYTRRLEVVHAIFVTRNTGKVSQDYGN